MKAEQREGCISGEEAGYISFTRGVLQGCTEGLAAPIGAAYGDGDTELTPYGEWNWEPGGWRAAL